MRAAVIVSALLAPALAQIDTSIVERYRADLEKQAASPEMKRQGGTQPQDWIYQLPDGVATRQVTFYSDGSPCHGKIFFPRGFSARGRWPAVVLGHGFNGISIGIEKYGARFAERGLVAMVIDYRTYGFSGGQVSLLEPDTSTDERMVWEKPARVQLKRTRLHALRQAEDYRSAISYLQGEPGVDREKIGVWGSSHSGGVVLTVAGLDARVKAVVSQVIGVGGRNVAGPAALPPNLLQDAITRARDGQGAEVDGGFSFRTKIDLETQQTGREHRPWAALARIPETTAVLWIPAEKDELANPRSPSGPYEAAKVFRGISQVAEIPSITHFQAYSGAAFEVGSTLAADWFLKHLASPAATPVPAPVNVRKFAAAASRVNEAMPEGVVARDVAFFSEGVRCYGRIYLPKDFSTGDKSPAVVLAPDWGETHVSVSRYAARFASGGLVSMAIDYRGWGKSGGYLYTIDPVRADDRVRFQQLSTNVRVVRKRLLPRHQVDDIRNGISYLQGEPGIDPVRIGLWGRGMAGGHLMAVAATDARVRAFVAVTPIIDGQDVPAKAEAPALLEDAIRQARAGLGATPDMAIAAETRRAISEYHPFHAIDQIPATAAVQFIVAGKDATVDAASKLLKGPNRVTAVSGAESFDRLADAAVEWFLKHL